MAEKETTRFQKNKVSRKTDENEETYAVLQETSQAHSAPTQIKFPPLGLGVLHSSEHTNQIQLGYT